MLFFCSIIAVQGLWADPEWTWKKHGVVWLSDLLPQDIPSACILSFGPTRSDRLAGASFSSISATAASISVLLGALGVWKPMWHPVSLVGAAGVLLGSSFLYLRRYLRRLRSTPLTAIHDCATQLLQTLVERQKTHAAFLATQDATFSGVIQHTQGFLFLGTPHAGSRLASVSQWWWLTTIPDIRKQLSVGSEYLVDLDKRFRAIDKVKSCGNVYCFYETRKMCYGPSLIPIRIFVVEKQSATWPNQPSIPAIALDRNHSQLTKYSSRDDNDYQKVVAALQTVVTTVDDSIAE
ncbi:hypothetical protein NLG97_g6719 [Lecanicillium saksenae]|uniref:Uncharacterized protein n=1 Tax=Lecanicillium saksenae TaxID=468837 RepID=A0ACC1QPE5_9HYPO|nr:hypothetical protein NLG97_g6719 [Lecanicillium saksenae]